MNARSRRDTWNPERGGRAVSDKDASGRPWTDEQLMFTPVEAAKALRISRTTLYALLKSGELRAVKIGRSTRLTKAELKRYVARLDATEASN